MKDLTKGMEVKIYFDPSVGRRLEGKAKIMETRDEYIDELQWCKVKFQGCRKGVGRWINRNVC